MPNPQRYLCCLRAFTFELSAHSHRPCSASGTMEGVREGASEFLGFEPIAVLGDMSNAFSDCARSPISGRSCVKDQCSLRREPPAGVGSRMLISGMYVLQMSATRAMPLRPRSRNSQSSLGISVRLSRCALAPGAIAGELAGRFSTPLRALPQGVNRWLMKMQRAGDSSFDRFESRALEESFHIPHDLQLVRSHSASFPREALARCA